MTFAKDRDLLALEPALFRDVAWAALRRVSASDAQVSGFALSSASSDFGAAGVDAGAVALVDGAPLEVVEREDAQTLTVSLLRASAGDPLIRPPSSAQASLSVMSFAPQLEAMHAEVMRALGLEPGAEELGEASVTNPRSVAHVEALGALHLVFAGAAALTGADSPAWTRAESYRERFGEARRRLCVGVDLDNDGRPDAVRRVSAARFIRA